MPALCGHPARLEVLFILQLVRLVSPIAIAAVSSFDFHHSNCFSSTASNLLARQDKEMAQRPWTHAISRPAVLGLRDEFLWSNRHTTYITTSIGLGASLRIAHSLCPAYCSQTLLVSSWRHRFQVPLAVPFFQRNEVPIVAMSWAGKDLST